MLITRLRRISALGPSGLRQFLIIAGIANTAGSTGLIGHHEYAVKGFNPLTNMVTLRNPHGQGVWNQRSPQRNHYHNLTALRDTPSAG